MPNRDLRQNSKIGISITTLGLLLYIYRCTHSISIHSKFPKFYFKNIVTEGILDKNVLCLQ